MTDIRTPPNDTAAEEAAIHAALIVGQIPEPLQDLEPADFYQPAHEAIWASLLWLRRNNRPCDGNATLARLMETQRPDLAQLLPDLVTSPWTGDPDNVAQILRDRSGRRHLIKVADRLNQQAYESEDPYEAILGQAERDLGKVPAQDTGSVESLMTLEEFLGVTEPEPEWVLPGLMARGERMILTGAEGLGKSQLCRQLGMCAAAGMDPFTGSPIPSMTVLVIDAENPTYIMQSRFIELRRAISAHGKIIEPNRLWIDRRPGGMNVGDAADRRWLQRRVHLINPDLLVIGPAYKLHESSNDDKDETIARTVTAVLDDLRGDAALVLEHHAGNEQGGQQRQMRPFGSSLWRRWPEFGRGLRMVKPPHGMTTDDVKRRRMVELVDWRGDRDRRAWPWHMESGGDGLPWVETVIA